MEAARRATRFANRLPVGIVSTEAYRTLTPGQKHVLQHVADRCDPPDERGHLIGAYGGRRLEQSCSVHRATFWRAIARLERDGLLVKLTLGGQLRVSGASGKRNVANVYAIPASIGGLDDRKALSRSYRMVRTADGTIRRETTREGEQASLWHRSEIEPCIGSDKGSGGVVAGCDRGSRRMRQGQSQDATPPYHRPSLNRGKNTMRAARDGLVRTAGKKWLHVPDGCLSNRTRLYQLLSDAINKGFVDGSEWSIDLFFGAAARSRGGQKPEAMMASIVSRGLWLYVSTADIEAGKRWDRDNADGR